MFFFNCILFYSYQWGKEMGIQRFVFLLVFVYSVYQADGRRSKYWFIQLFLIFLTISNWEDKDTLRQYYMKKQFTFTHAYIFHWTIYWFFKFFNIYGAFMFLGLK